MPAPKPDLHPLKTPKSFTFPSEIQNDPKPCSPRVIKQEDNVESPIPTPSAYTEFLNALTPVFASPVSAGGSFPKFTFDPSPTSQPSTATSPAFSSAPSLKSPSLTLPPPSPRYVKPPSPKGLKELKESKISKSPHTLRRLRIPQSLKTLSTKDLPRTATPMSATPRSASAIHSPFSPTNWKLHYFSSPRSATPRSATSTKPVSVRQVVTRTVTYKRTPLDPPPKGKRRKTHECNKARECKEV
ncbi:hypothetical protein N7533_012937 [Penicillium manginii]|uniref:uncharacterized protein n=1 Tax=Penicillium manginii TaxID=203109 RepID=UPI0025477020|nr:uncharacterized protein N7533_013795 [Penicillium manginii]XP_056953172.1 uncharacterized protein N7533_012937 [Penicillium manginii]KAJ5733348.1 hypothetical protein N7533_013795 [Penicillium manginii]KAJ5734534.1 hypothetical protein N7533_012937 [Penicillium manginii]